MINFLNLLTKRLLTINRYSIFLLTISDRKKSKKRCEAIANNRLEQNRRNLKRKRSIQIKCLRIREKRARCYTV